MQEEINRLQATQSQSVTPEGNERSVHAAIFRETDSPTSRHVSDVHSPARREQVQGTRRDEEMEHSEEDNRDTKESSDGEENHSGSSAHTPVSTRSTVNARKLTNDDDMNVDSDEDGKDENKPTDFESEISDIGSDYGSIENEDEEEASSSIIELSGDSSSDAASSYMPMPPHRKGRYASSRFSPCADENTRPHSLRRTNSVTGSEGLGVRDSD